MSSFSLSLSLSLSEASTIFFHFFNILKHSIETLSSFSPSKKQNPSLSRAGLFSQIAKQTLRGNAGIDIADAAARVLAS